mmetsp:Transcript_17626/g.43021  ORF Transcript_17626/g.43021 Transcript_17626/m.43021 type:complete len:549 (+) Transcript_17626:23-1669(+)
MADGGANYEPVRASDAAPADRVPDTFWHVCALEFLAAFGDRLWLFAIPILFTEIWVGDLLPIAIYNICLYFALLIIMPYAGTLVDHQSRIRLMSISIVLDNIFACFASAFCFATSFYIGNDKVLWGLFACTIVCSVIAQFFANTSNIALEKDWLPVIAGRNSDSLRVLNSALRRVDLFCKFIAPMSFGIMIQAISLSRQSRIRIGTSVLLVWNLATLFPEISLARAVYAKVPGLTSKRGSKTPANRRNNNERKNGLLADPSGNSLESAHPDRKAQEMWRSKENRCFHFWRNVPGIGALVDGWSTWIGSEVWGISLGYSLLYGNILSPGPLLTAYLKTIDIPEVVVGLSMGLGALFGLIGTVIFAPLSKRMSLPGVGFLTIWLWCIFLAPSVAVSLIHNAMGFSLNSARNQGYVILVCVTVGRIWLWAFDLAETQIIQEWVHEEERGRVSGSQSSLCTLFELAVYGLSVAYHKPEQFQLLIYVSFAFVFSGAIVQSIWFCCVGPYPTADADYLNLEVQFLELSEGKEDALDGRAKPGMSLEEMLDADEY